MKQKQLKINKFYPMQQIQNFPSLHLCLIDLTQNTFFINWNETHHPIKVKSPISDYRKSRIKDSFARRNWNIDFRYLASTFSASWLSISSRSVLKLFSCQLFKNISSQNLKYLCADFSLKHSAFFFKIQQFLDSSFVVRFAAK